MKSNRWGNLIGYVGVDSGLMYLGDPCYMVDRELGKMSWGDFLARYVGGSGPAWLVHGDSSGSLGIVCRSGAGDGSYPVTLRLLPDGTVASMTITFVDEVKE